VRLKAPKSKVKGKNVQVVVNGVENYVAELQEKYGSMGLIFHNALKQNVVAIVWRPSEFLPKVRKERETIPL